MKQVLITLTTILSLLGLTNVATAATPYVTVGAGYQWVPKNSQKHQYEATNFGQKDGMVILPAIGVEFDNKTRMQVEYTSARLDTVGWADKSTQNAVSLVGHVPVYKNTYGIVGAGWNRFHGKGVGVEETAMATIGLGADYQFNKALTGLVEARTTYDMNNNYWNPQVMVGVRINPVAVYNSATGK